MIETGGEWGSGRSVLAAQHDNDDGDESNHSLLFSSSFVDFKTDYLSTYIFKIYLCGIFINNCTIFVQQ